MNGYLGVARLHQILAATFTKFWQGPCDDETGHRKGGVKTEFWRICRQSEE